MKRILLTILTVLGIIILVVGIGLFCFIYSFKKALELKVDPALYADIVSKKAEYSDQYKFLPEAIPQDAIKVAFLHIPGFLQGGDVIALRVSLPRNRIEEIITDLELSGREEIESFEGIPTPRAYPEYGMKKPGPKNRFEGMTEIPKDFRIFLYESDIEDIKKNWNHNILSFTAVSLERNEVVYFIDNW